MSLFANEGLVVCGEHRVNIDGEPPWRLVTAETLPAEGLRADGQPRCVVCFWIRGGKDKLIATLARLLREREWTPDEVLPDPSDGDVRCVSCNAVGENNTGAHKPGCELASALAAAEGLVKP